MLSSILPAGHSHYPSVTASPTAPGVSCGIERRYDTNIGTKEHFLKTHVKLAIICSLAASVSLPALAQNSGADIFKAKCQMCHGPDGTANTPAGHAIKAASFKTPSIVQTPDAELIAIVKNGKGKMPAFAGKLTDDQIKAAVAYIRILQKS
jgi:cytochrome c5